MKFLLPVTLGLSLAACGSAGSLKPPEGKPLPVKPAMAQVTPTPEDLLAKPAFAAPERIEVYDNSHIMGTNMVGAMIVAGREGMLKGQYRKFNIKRPETAPGDDFAMMREVLERRFARLEKEAREMLDAEGIPEDRVRLTREIDMRYVGQWRALPIEVEAPLESLDPVVEQPVARP